MGFGGDEGGGREGGGGGGGGGELTISLSMWYDLQVSIRICKVPLLCICVAGGSKTPVNGGGTTDFYARKKDLTGQ
jgi:hypothetical protein